VGQNIEKYLNYASRHHGQPKFKILINHREMWLSSCKSYTYHGSRVVA